MDVVDSTPLVLQFTLLTAFTVIPVVVLTVVVTVILVALTAVITASGCAAVERRSCFGFTGAFFELTEADNSTCDLLFPCSNSKRLDVGFCLDPDVVIERSFLDGFLCSDLSDLEDDLDSAFEAFDLGRFESGLSDT